ncbi:MAG: hypothetical protein NVS1B11_03480 [Terriglobales bacterium]
MLQTPLKSESPSKAKIVFALILGVLVGVIGLAEISRKTDSSIWNHILSALTGRSTSFDVNQPTVVNKIQQLHRLETVVYTMDKVVTGEKNNPILPDFLTGDRLLLLVHGEVIAGIDFGNLNSDEVKLSAKQVRLHLPDAQLFTTRLDSEKTRVYSRQTGLLVPTDPNLETQVRAEAERQLHDAALADGILRTAQQNARATITSLLQGLGFETIEFD